MSNASGKVAASAVTSTELGYLDGVTSGIQGQLNNLNTALGNKQNNITGAASTIATENLTHSKALISNISGKVGVSAVTATELSYLGGLTGNIMTLLNGKAASSHTHTIANITGLQAELNKITDKIYYGTTEQSSNTTSGVYTIKSFGINESRYVNITRYDGTIKLPSGGKYFIIDMMNSPRNTRVAENSGVINGGTTLATGAAYIYFAGYIIRIS